MSRWHWSLLIGSVAAAFAACGPDHRPEEPCEGPSFNLVVRTESGAALPADTRINVRYGGNPDGEPYALGVARTPQAVSCSEDTAGASSVDDGAGGDGASMGGTTGAANAAVYALRCGLYTQGPARVDVTATGYEPVEDEALSFDRKRHCEVPIELTLMPERLDGGP